MKKIILMISLVLLLTGCTAKYNIKINLNNTVEESSNINVSQTILKYDDMGDTPEEFVESFTKILNYRSGSYRYRTQEFIDEKTMGFSASKNYKDLDLLATNSPFSTYLYDGMRVTKNGSKVVLESIGKFKTAAINCQWCNYPKLQDSYLAIQLPYKVVNSNATRVDTSKNIYYWNISYNQYPEKIYFEYDTMFLYSYNILDWLPFLNYYTIFIIIAAIIILIIVLILKQKGKKSNTI